MYTTQAFNLSEGALRLAASAPSLDSVIHLEDAEASQSVSFSTYISINLSKKAKFRLERLSIFSNVYY